MSYINTAWLTDKHIRDIATRNTITNELTLCDMAINRFAQSKGVAIENIPVDDDGYLTTFALIEYGRYWLYNELLQNYWGASHGEDDIYFSKLSERYEMKLNEAIQNATYESILNNSPLSKSAFFRTVPVL